MNKGIWIWAANQLTSKIVNCFGDLNIFTAARYAEAVKKGDKFAYCINSKNVFDSTAISKLSCVCICELIEENNFISYFPKDNSVSLVASLASLASFVVAIVSCLD